MGKPWKTCPLCGGRMEYLFVQDGAGSYEYMCVDFEWHRLKTQVLHE